MSPLNKQPTKTKIYTKDPRHLSRVFVVLRKPPAMLVVQESLQRGKKNNLPSGKLSVGFPTTQKEPGRYPYEKGQ